MPSSWTSRQFTKRVDSPLNVVASVVETVFVPLRQIP